MCKIFADDTSLFSIENSTHSSQSVLNSDLKCINEWAYQWKMHFSPDPKKQANEVIFSQKSNKNIYPPVTFNNNHVKNCSHQNHLGVILDSKLDFILYDKPGNQNFENKIERVQYKACIVITGAIQGSSKERLYDELGLISLKERRWYNKLIFFYKIVNGLLPKYLQSFLETYSQKTYSLRSQSSDKLKSIPCRTKTFKNTFSPYCIDEWNNLDKEIRNAKSLYKFKKFFKTEKPENSLYNVYDPVGVKLLSLLRLQFSHLNEHKFRYEFNDSVDPMCPCGSEVETTEHFSLRCQCFSIQRSELFNNLRNLDPSFTKLDTKEKTSFLLYGSNKNSSSLNKDILEIVIKFIKATGRFNKPLLITQ